MTTQHNSREAFEKYRETVSKNLISLQLYNELHIHDINYPMQYQAWQASEEYQAATTAELTAQRNHWQNMAGKFANDEHESLERLVLAGIDIAQLQLDNERLREALGKVVDNNYTARDISEAIATQPTLAERGYKDIKYLACSKCGVMPDEAIATRLRRVCTALKLTSAVPDDDLELYRCMFSVLGIIARKLETQPTEEYNPFINEGK